MISSNLLLWGGAVVLCSMASPIFSFSHGASRTSCQEMIPGHIRAHPLDPKHSFITIQTSASSYLPGQLLTVTIRSSRDFMGFMLQARSAGGGKNGFGGGKMERLGPLLVGGSWIRYPPGTHTLRCLYEGDTVTHSDKHLKRNLSFVWRAPDMPKGDIRFHITVVQSYFIYWTGIESAVVRDRSPGAWRGSKTKIVDGASTIFAAKETVTAQTALRANKATKKQSTGRATPASFLGHPSNIKSATEILKFQEIQTEDDHTTSEITSSVTWTNHTVTEKKRLTLGPPPHNTHGNPNGKTNEPFSYTTSTFPITSSLPDTTYTTTHFPLGTFPPCNSVVPSSTQNVVWSKSNDLQIKSQEQSVNNNPGKKQSYMTLASKTTQGPFMKTFHSLKSPRPTDHNSKDQSKRISAKFKTLSRSDKLIDSYLTKSEMSIFQTEVTPFYQASSFRSSLFQMAASIEDLRSQIYTTQTSTEPKRIPKRTSSPQITMPNVHQALPVTKSTQNQPISVQRERKQSGISTEALRLSSRPLSQTKRSFSQSFVTSQPVTMTPVSSFVPSTTQSSISASDYLEVSSSSDSLSGSSVVHLSENVPLHRSVPSITSTSSIHSSFSRPKNEHKTTPAHSVPQSPSPISMPPLLTLAKQYYITTHPIFPTSSTISSLSASNYPSKSSLPPSTSPPFTTSSTFSSKSTRSPDFSTFSSNSYFYPSTPTFPSPSVSATSSSTSSPLRASSSSRVSPITSPYSEPTSAPLFINSPFLSSESHKATIDQNLTAQTRHTSPEAYITSPSNGKFVHPNPKPYPNLRPNHAQEFKPNNHNRDTKPNHPSETPDKDGKYPDIIPRHRSWELGMLLVCSAGLGMVLVVGVRYVYRHACGWRTEVTLNDHEREYGRGEQGLIQLQECGDLVRVRKIRENSFVFLAEYDILASPSN